MLLFASFAALLVIAPAAQAARYALIQRSVIGEVFSSIRPEGAAAPVDAEDPWEGTDRVNILLVGSDAGPDRTGVRPDSMVASIDTTTGKTVLFGIPRNLQNIPLSPDSPLRAQYRTATAVATSASSSTCGRSARTTRRSSPATPAPV
ncbi:hypothetical protein [Janibacter melonis]|uniref:hypothetical protein n=1 Tax=Janibacter melonis TaxID=262209 RepID=UPI002096085C|nr:hypothetical protein [Janibacter melonis]